MFIRGKISWGLCVGAFLAAGSLLSAQHEKRVIDFDYVSDEAAEMVESAPRPRVEKLSKALKELSYDDYRNIRFRPSEALWWNDPSRFRVEFFHLGHIFHDPVEIFEYTDSHVQKVPFREEAYNYEQSSYKPGFFNAPDNHAGIRIKYPLNRKDVYDDLIVFLGASYFRALGPNQAYGLSLRGLGMNTLGDHEDFPRFTKLWLKKPKQNDKSLRVLGLLEGEKVTGAYQFDIKCNGITEIEVQARLYFRQGGAGEVGIAPITSMFVFGENSAHRFEDWRPEVHDSDGVLVQTGENDWIWHPIENLPGRYDKHFPTDSLKGYGLMQRDRDFTHYKDLEANYEKRPSAWITPLGDWPPGAVVLYTFETNSEATDNVTLFWKPDLQADSDEPLELNYKIGLQLKGPVHPFARVLETRIGHRTLDPNSRTVLVEFSRPEQITPEEIPMLRAEFSADPLEALDPPVVQYNPAEDRIRVFVNLRKPAPEASHQNYELSAQLFQDDKAISEKWSYTWKP